MSDPSGGPGNIKHLRAEVPARDFSPGAVCSRPMPVPEQTSPEAFARYVGAKSLRVGRGRAWHDLKAWILAPPRTAEMVPLPAVSEPAIAWTYSGEAEFQEREKGKPWMTHRLRKGSFFLTSGGAPYDCRWRVVGPEPFETMLVFLELPLLDRALAEVFGADAPRARLRDLSAVTDGALDALMESLRAELMRRKASALFVQGIAQALAIHLARNYAEAVAGAGRGASSLPGYKLKQLTDWMGEHLADGFDLGQLAARVGLSKFHFHRLFKGATGLSPARYHLNLRLDAARRLLRETNLSVVAVGLEVGYSNPSHFAQLFRRETGLSPSDYRRER
jgi:AraC family transcriptional regulator